MQSIILKSVLAIEMEEVFNNSNGYNEQISIKYFNNLSLKKGGGDCELLNEYDYEIAIRHNEDKEPNMEFDKAINNCRKAILKKIRDRVTCDHSSYTVKGKLFVCVDCGNSTPKLEL